MHEFSITESLLNQALAAAREQQATEILAIKLRVGQGRSIVPECVQFYFETLRQGTLAARASLDIEVVPLKVVCRKCRTEVKELQPQCSCAAGVEIVSGQELEIEYLEIEQGEAQSAVRNPQPAIRSPGRKRPAGKPGATCS